MLVGVSYGAAVSAAPATSTLNGSANGRAVRVHRGAEIVVTLHSTYWSFDHVGGKALKSLGRPVYDPAPKGECVPGAGCGTVTARFRAESDGVTMIRAGRTSCGEALACAPSQRTFQVTVTVTR